MGEKLRWGILGAGRIAGTFATGVTRSRTGVLAAVGSRSQASADKFADKYDIKTRHTSYEALLADANVDAVYIATPHPMHAQWAIRAAEAGKHVLCEKPIGLNHAEAMAIIAAAKENDVFLMEAFMYRCHPQIAKLLELIRDKAIGEVRLIQGTFAFHAAFNPDSRTYSNALGGGGILDVGCYPVSISRLIAGAANGKDFVEPISIKAVGQLGQTGIDEYSVASATFPGDIQAQWATGIGLALRNVVQVFGSEGNILLNNPWLPAVAGGEVEILLQKKGQSDPEVIKVPNEDHLYGLEADTVSKYLENRQAVSPCMSWNDTLGNMRTLDRWRAEIGLVYDSEKIEAPLPPVHGRALKLREKNNMKYANVSGVKKRLSRLVMGVDNQRTLPHAAVMFDDYYEHGGNVFDTAYVYGGGKTEGLLGEWIQKRGVRDEVVIISKGAHTPFCNPAGINKHLMASLERLKVDSVDIYMLHRDNLELPVSDFIDVLNEHKKAGRVDVLGASNWSLERVDEANAYAASKGLEGFSAVSNNFSLARMVDPVWKGCLSVSDAESRAWFKEKQMALMPWSSQARGFFVRADPEMKDDAELVRCWYSDDNFKRMDRVQEMARERGVEPINVALAYVLCQPFPTFPLFGPRTIEELRSSLGGLNLDLSDEDLRFLNLES